MGMCVCVEREGVEVGVKYNGTVCVWGGGRGLRLG